MSRLSWAQQLPSESVRLHELEYRGSDHNGDTAFIWTETKLLIHISFYKKWVSPNGNTGVSWFLKLGYNVYYAPIQKQGTHIFHQNYET